MMNYDLIAAVHKHGVDEGFSEGDVSRLTVKQIHLLVAKLTLIFDASRSADKHRKILALTDCMQRLIPDLQAGELNTAIRNADRSTLLFLDVEMSHESVASVVATSHDPNRAFWLIGNGNGDVDVNAVVRKS
jgi:hypothetical protein